MGTLAEWTGWPGCNRDYPFDCVSLSLWVQEACVGVGCVLGQSDTALHRVAFPQRARSSPPGGAREAFCSH